MLILVYAVVVIRTAWVMDDAYISFRCVDNAIHGYGLRWNTFERVEAFTNPLWTLVMCAFSLATREIFYTGLALQIAISTAAVWLVARSARAPVVACGCVATLSLSKAFVDYSTVRSSFRQQVGVRLGGGDDEPTDCIDLYMAGCSRNRRPHGASG